MDAGMLSLWFGNYANLAAKALRPRLSSRFAGYSEFFGQAAARGRGGAAANNAALAATAAGLIAEVAAAYPPIERSAGTNRGMLRAYTWGSKVAAILKSAAGRVSAKGDQLLGDGQAFFVCDACGFMFIGGAAPEICPVCKAPAARFVRY